MPHFRYFEFLQSGLVLLTCLATGSASHCCANRTSSKWVGCASAKCQNSSLVSGFPENQARYYDYYPCHRLDDMIQVFIGFQQTLTTGD